MTVPTGKFLELQQPLVLITMKKAFVVRFWQKKVSMRTQWCKSPHELYCLWFGLRFLKCRLLWTLNPSHLPHKHWFPSHRLSAIYANWTAWVQQRTQKKMLGWKTLKVSQTDYLAWMSSNHVSKARHHKVLVYLSVLHIILYREQLHRMKNTWQAMFQNKFQSSKNSLLLIPNYNPFYRPAKTFKIPTWELHFG